MSAFRSAVLAAALAAIGCSERPRTTAVEVAPAVARGVAYLEEASEGQPHALALGHFLHRRFGVEGFEDAPARYDAILRTASPPREAKHRTMPNPGALRLFRRLLVADNAYAEADLADAEGSLDLTTTRALYCDREPLPADYRDLIRSEAAAGYYQLTHAALALAWFRDNGCEPPVTAAETTAWMDGLEAIVRTHPLHDVGLEAAALLAYLGEAGRLPEGHAARVMAAAEPDGGWRPCPDPPCDPPTGLRPEVAASHWHPTALALWLLLETTTERPADRFVPAAASTHLR